MFKVGPIFTWLAKYNINFWKLSFWDWVKSSILCFLLRFWELESYFLDWFAEDMIWSWNNKRLDQLMHTYTKHQSIIDSFINHNHHLSIKQKKYNDLWLWKTSISSSNQQVAVTYCCWSSGSGNQHVEVEPAGVRTVESASQVVEMVCRRCVAAMPY